jgi:hypothetical protein
MNEILSGEITKPCKHGFVIDMQDGERRVHVRVFEFENQQMPGLDEGIKCEMPVSIDEGHAISRLRQAMERMRERAREMGGNAIPPSKGEGAGV